MLPSNETTVEGSVTYLSLKSDITEPVTSTSFRERFRNQFNAGTNIHDWGRLLNIFRMFSSI